MLSKANKLHGYHTYNMGMHSCSATSIWLYDGPHTGCAFVLQYYHLQRGCVGTCELWAVQNTHQGFPPPGVACGAKVGTTNFRTTTNGAAPTSPPEGVFHSLLPKKYRRAVGTHYGPTRTRQAGFSLCHRRDCRAGTTILKLVSASDDRTVRTEALISDYGAIARAGRAAGARATPPHPPEPQDRSAGLRAGGRSK